MSLARFSIIVAIDKSNGIAKNGNLPWSSRSDMQFFREKTVGNGKNVVIMGRKTYESIPPDHRPLKSRLNVVVSRTWKQEDHMDVTIYPSFLEALIGVGSMKNRYENVFVIGGESIYNESVREYMYLCNEVFVTKFKEDYDCDQFFSWEKISDMPQIQSPTKTRDYTRYFIRPNVTHGEHTYLKLLNHVLENGEQKSDRTGTGTLSCFDGSQMVFDISERIPVITTKKLDYNKVIRELLFFISGKTDTKILEQQNVNIWKGNTSTKFLETRNLDYEEGDMGPLYGFQWRHWGAEYKGCEFQYDGQGVDQLSALIDGIKGEPHSRRHILSAWNVGDLEKMCLPPCHAFVQFNVSGDKKYLDCCLYQRSADLFLGVPWNIASYSMLTYMIAHLTGLKPRKFIHDIGDAHIYSNHIQAVNKQLKRTPRPFPTLRFRRAIRINKIDDFEFDHFVVDGYTCWPYIKGKMAV